jgi:TPR repeat protein
MLDRAYDLYQAGDYEGALYLYERTALMGYEIGQENTAWMYSMGFGTPQEGISQVRS